MLFILDTYIYSSQECSFSFHFDRFPQNSSKGRISKALILIDKFFVLWEGLILKDLVEMLAPRNGIYFAKKVLFRIESILVYLFIF